MKKEDLIRLGNRVKEIRRALDISQKDFAAGIDVSASYLSEIESGKTKPGYNFLTLLYTNYNVNPSWLLVEEGEMFANEKGKTTIGELDFGEQADEVYEMLELMNQSPFVQSTVLSHFIKFYYENEGIIEKDIEKNKKK